MEAMEERLQSSVQVPANPPYRLSMLISEASQQASLLCMEIVWLRMQLPVARV